MRCRSRPTVTGRRTGFLLAAALAYVLSSATSASAGPGHDSHTQTEDATEFDRDAALDHSQAAIGRLVENHRFTTADGRQLALHELRGKPLVLSMIFTSCYHTCPLITRNLVRTVDIAREALGEDSFAVLTVGFDWEADTPQRMASFAADQGIKVADWYFLSADEATVRALSDDTGFLFFPSPRGFDHLAQTTVIDAGSKVHWQVYGATFEAPHLVEPLKQLVFKHNATPLSLSDWIDGVKFFCTVYDPASGRYRFDYSIFVALFAGLLSLGAVAIFIVRSWRQSA